MVPAKSTHPKPQNRIELVQGSQHDVGLILKGSENLVVRPTPSLKGVNFGVPKGFGESPFGEQGDGEADFGRIKA